MQNHLKIVSWSFLTLLFLSCSDNKIPDNNITLLVTSNVRGQLDPCG